MNKCKECGNCCENVLILQPEEIKTIHDYIKENKIKPINRNNIFSQTPCAVCPFLNNDKKCNIYKVRPQICRNFYCSGEVKRFDFEDYRYAKVVDMLDEFSEKSIFYPNKPNVKEIEDEIKRKYKEISKTY